MPSSFDAPTTVCRRGASTKQSTSSVRRPSVAAARATLQASAGGPLGVGVGGDEREHRGVLREVGQLEAQLGERDGRRGHGRGGGRQVAFDDEEGAVEGPALRLGLVAGRERPDDDAPAVARVAGRDQLRGMVRRDELAASSREAASLCDTDTWTQRRRAVAERAAATWNPP